MRYSLDDTIFSPRNQRQYHYAFGMQIQERHWKDSTFSYRFGFNGYEQEPDIAGKGSVIDFGVRIYDSRLGRWLSVDSLQLKYPDQGPYSFCYNSPIKFIDIDGGEVTITGVEAAKLIKMLEERTGLDLSLDANGKLTYATTTTVSISPRVEKEIPVINSIGESYISEKLQTDLISTKGPYYLRKNVQQPRRKS